MERHLAALCENRRGGGPGAPRSRLSRALRGLRARPEAPRERSWPWRRRDRHHCIPKLSVPHIPSRAAAAAAPLHLLGKSFFLMLLAIHLEGFCGEKKKRTEAELNFRNSASSDR